MQNRSTFPCVFRFWSGEASVYLSLCIQVLVRGGECLPFPVYSGSGQGRRVSTFPCVFRFWSGEASVYLSLCIRVLVSEVNVYLSLCIRVLVRGGECLPFPVYSGSGQGR